MSRPIRNEFLTPLAAGEAVSQIEDVKLGQSCQMRVMSSYSRFSPSRNIVSRSKRYASDLTLVSPTPQQADTSHIG